MNEEQDRTIYRAARIKLQLGTHLDITDSELLAYMEEPSGMESALIVGYYRNLVYSISMASFFGGRIYHPDQVLAIK